MIHNIPNKHLSFFNLIQYHCGEHILALGKGIFLLLLMLLCFAITSHAQYSVNPATGKLNYSIPLVETTIGKKPFTFALTYTSSGMKIDVPYSATGYQWDLNVSPVSITREIRGNCEDENITDGYLYTSSLTLDSVAKRKQDGESDKFTLNYFGSTYTFLLKKVGQNFEPFFLEPCDLKISSIVITSSLPRARINGWIIMDTEGNRYNMIYTEQVLLDKKADIYYFESDYIPVKWEIKEVEMSSQDTVRWQYGENVVLPKFFNLKILKSYAQGRYMMGIDDVGIRSSLQQAVSNYTNAYGNLVGMSTELQHYIDESSNYIDYSRSILNSSSLRNAPSHFIAMVFRQQNHNVTTINQRLGFLEQQYGNYAGTLNNLQNQVDFWMTESRQLAPTYKFNDFHIIKHTSMSRAEALKAIDFNEFKKMSVYYDTLSSSNVGSEVTKFRRINSIIYATKQSRRHIYFQYLDTLGDMSDVLKRVTILGNDNRTVIEDYRLEYINEQGQLENRRYSTSFGQTFPHDYWGYNNTGIPDWQTPFYDGNYFLGKYDPITDPISEFLPDMFFPIFPSYTGEPGTFDEIHDTSWSITIPANRIPYSSDADVVKTDMDNREGRRPNLSAMNLALWKVRDVRGREIEFSYENNDVYIPDIDSTLLTGGIRIKTIKDNDGLGNISDIQYKYSYANEQGKMISSGIFDEYGRWHMMELADGYPTLKSRPFYTGKLMEDNSNEGVFYHYVEEVLPDLSYVGYKFPSVIENYKESQSSGWGKNLSSMGNLLLAKVYYDKDDQIKSITRYGYEGNSHNLMHNREQELSLLQGNFPYLDLISTTGQDSLAQHRSLYVDQIHQSTYDDVHDGLIQDNKHIEASIYQSANQANVFQTGQNNHQVASYMAYSNGLEFRLKRTQNIELYLVGNQHGQNLHLHNGLPKTKPYLYERILADETIPKVERMTEYVYQDDGSTNMKTILESGSELGETIETTFTYLSDYAAAQLPVGLQKLKAQNKVTSAIEVTQSLLEGSNAPLVLGSTLNLFNSDGLVQETLSRKESSNAFTPSYVSGGTFYKDPLYETVSKYNLYDEKENAIEVEVNGQTSSLLYHPAWDLPVASFANSSYQAILGHLSQNTLDSLNEILLPTIEELKLVLKKVPSSIARRASTYLEDLGISQVIDEAGRITSYKYGDDNRLKTILDEGNNVAQVYAYNEKTTSEFALYDDRGFGFHEIQVSLGVPFYVGFNGDESCLVQIIDIDGNVITQKYLDDVESIWNGGGGSEELRIGFMGENIKIRFVFNKRNDDPYLSFYYDLFHFNIFFKDGSYYPDDVMYFKDDSINEGTGSYLETDYIDMSLLDPSNPIDITIFFNWIM